MINKGPYQQSTWVFKNCSGCSIEPSHLVPPRYVLVQKYDNYFLTSHSMDNDRSYQIPLSMIIDGQTEQGHKIP